MAHDLSPRLIGRLFYVMDFVFCQFPGVSSDRLIVCDHLINLVPTGHGVAGSNQDRQHRCGITNQAVSEIQSHVCRHVYRINSS